MIAAHQIAFGGSAKRWENPYITDGLVAMWDGEWNASGGKHDPSATVWKDLVGGGYDGKISSKLSWGENYLRFVAGSPVDFGSVPIGDGALRIEVVIDTSSATSFTCYVGQGSARYIGNSGGGNSPSIKKVAFRSGQTSSNNYGIEYTGSESLNYISAGYSEDGLVHSIYTDGIFRVQKEFTSKFKFSNTGLLMNREYKETYGSGNFDAYCVRVYNRALTAEEIAYNYNIDKQRFGL